MRNTAIRFAMIKHEGQARKYTEEPYYTHCLAVAKSVAKFTEEEHVFIAALLHDTIEDTNTTYEEIRDIFGKQIAILVLELTDRYTKENYPDLNRKERKFLEACRLETISQEAKLIKYFDIMDNSKTIFEYDVKFAKTYLKEKQFIISYSLADLKL